MRRVFSIVITLFLIAFSSKAQVTFVIEHLPHATPPEDTIFISGTFNDWRMSPEYAFRKRLDGKLTVTVQATHNFEYKFARGNWAKAETTETNSFRPNRHYAGNERIIRVSILNWQDVGGARTVSVFPFYFFTLSFVFLITRHFLIRIKLPQRAFINSVLEFQLVISIALLGRVAMEVLPLEFTPYVVHIGELLIVFCCVIFFDIVTRATGRQSPGPIHFIPTCVLLGYLLLKIFNVNFLMFLNDRAFGNLTWDDIIVDFFILCNLSWCCVRAWRLVSGFDAETDGMKLFLRIHIFLGAIFILALVVIIITVGAGRDLPTVLNNALPFCASLFVISTCWFALNHDEVFRVLPSEFPEEESQRFRKWIDKIMVSERLFINPNLSLNDLANRVGVKPHALSRILNEGFSVSFRDFVNTYRVDEFIHLAKQESSKRFTYLALAYEVGFNSKSTFNAAFKKIMHVSPREYFQQQKDNSLDTNKMKSTTL